MGKKLTNETFLDKAKKIHGDKYTYLDLKYVNSTSKVKIECNKCGHIFMQTPACHLNGQGCPKCVGKFKYDTDSFIKELKNKFPVSESLNFNETIYENSKQKISIICPIHGIFRQTPNNLLNGHLCPKCGKERGARKISYTNNTFIIAANKKHNNKYNYSVTNYKHANTKVEIECPDHGIFKQTPGSHLFGSGCPICRESSLEKMFSSFLIENKIKYIRGYNPQILNNGKGQQTLDFYLPDYNIAIECQGIQHFIYNNFFDPYEQIIERDIRKFKICADNNLKILYFTTNNNKLVKDKNDEVYDNIYTNNLYTNLNKIKKQIYGINYNKI